MPTSPVQTMDEDEEGPLPPQGLTRFKAVENTNYAIELAKANKMHIVGIQGADIVDGKKTLILGVTWQLMRCACRLLSSRVLCTDDKHALTG